MSSDKDVGNWTYPDSLKSKFHYVQEGRISLCGRYLFSTTIRDGLLNDSWKCKICKNKLNKLQDKNND